MVCMGHDVHDALVKAILAHPEHAAGALKAVLPAALVAQLDFGTLALCPGSFVDETLRHSHCRCAATCCRRPPVTLPSG